MKSKEKILKYVAVCERAEALGIRRDRLDTIMDIEGADLVFNLRLDDWLKADDANFLHDFVGITSNIVRSEFPAVDFGEFVPRFSGN